MSDKPNDDRDAFGAITAVAHELRTPLTAIQGALEILRDGIAGELSPAQREFANLAQRNLARLRDRIEDALDIARLKGGAAWEPAAIALEELAACVAKRTALETSAELQVRFEGFAGNLQLAMEDRAFCRTLASIVGTVGRHLGKGVVTVSATIEKSRIRLMIAGDDPAGERRGHTEIHSAGLALACEMVELHGGSLSGLDPGRCGVYVLLPLWPICTQGGR